LAPLDLARLERLVHDERGLPQLESGDVAAPAPQEEARRRAIRKEDDA